ncbi:hypothetical protein FCV82_02210 [Vibrio breoganii]|uniref:hypothetical protein n=1 Tax=Vibrio breoganii TaxID=553239 RepID=UPI000C840B1C|nr:hypothetical protein [Vibrio breoganii]PMN67110.1 hypothetical protein BCT28_03915 [Vibrio breoganii]PMO82913.1 hypothetical protein BCT00_06685 [Vibrio breoganii]TKF90406.1 hypothetical protein FCV82_02210 [Vibrio breoganii]
METKQSNNTSSVQDQALAALALQMENLRTEAMNIAVDKQDKALSLALEQIDAVKEKLKDPTNFLGRMDTKHGEVAEKIEIAIRNARQALDQNAFKPEEFTATFEGVGRTAPEDYIINGIEVQSKFINGINNNLKHVIDHMDKYDHFGRDGSYYHIPKDTHESILKILNGEQVGDLNPKTIAAVQDKVRLIEEMSGKSFNDVVLPGNSTYSEVQLFNADDTLNNHKSDLDGVNKTKVEDISSDGAYKASLEEAGTAALAGAAVGATISVVSTIYEKHKDGRNIFKGEFTKEDWRELGFDSGKAALIGGISGAAIYGLTNYVGMAAPFAGAIVTANKGISSLAMQYKDGEITFDELVDLSMVISGESAAVSLSAAAGQTLIPIPVLGAVLGSLAGKICCEYFKKADQKLLAAFESRMKLFTDSLTDQERKVLDSIEAQFKKLTNLTEAAFDFDNNYQVLNLSVELAEAHGVDESKIIKSTAELDDFMLG